MSIKIKRISKKKREQIEKRLASEVEAYSSYLNGEVYFYQIKQGEEEKDSCGEFIGMDHEKSGLMECAKNAIDCEIKVPLSFSSKVTLWFIGTVLNTVKHPTQGNHQLTKEQLKYSPSDYKNALYKAMEKAYKDEPVMMDKKIKELDKKIIDKV